MSAEQDGQIRRSQVITTYGPGALIDLPDGAAIVGGLNTWPRDLERIVEPRLERKLEQWTGVASPALHLPPPDTNEPGARDRGIVAWSFPEWFVVQEQDPQLIAKRTRRFIHRTGLDGKRKYDQCSVVPTRFVRACPRGHVDDIDWMYFVHQSRDRCMKSRLWLDESGTSGDLAELAMRCECGTRRLLQDAAVLDTIPLGTCSGRRPWLGVTRNETCTQPSRLLIRTASNAYFPQVFSVLSLPDRGTKVDTAVGELWDDLMIVETEADLAHELKKPKFARALGDFDRAEILRAIAARRTGYTLDKPVKQVELDAILAAPEGFGDDVPIDPNFHARRLADALWRNSNSSDGVERVVQMHRLREVIALAGFTRLEPVMPDIYGEYAKDTETAEIDLEPRWYPAVENRGEGVFVQLRHDAVQKWAERPAVKERLKELRAGHEAWATDRKSKRDFPQGPYILLHTLSHLLIQSVSMRCGYPATSIRERIYVDYAAGRFGLLLYTATPDAEGTLGGLVQTARQFEDHLEQALRMASLCSNDPICAQHAPTASMEGRWLHGAACHGCALIAETSCEMRNEYLDRGLVVPIVGADDTAFFPMDA